MLIIGIVGKIFIYKHFIYWTIDLAILFGSAILILFNQNIARKYMLGIKRLLYHTTTQDCNVQVFPKAEIRRLPLDSSN